MSGAILPLPQYAFMAWCLFKAQGQLYLFYLLRLHERERLIFIRSAGVQKPRQYTMKIGALWASVLLWMVVFQQYRVNYSVLKYEGKFSQCLTECHSTKT
jgi:hypothetical protein